MPFCLIPADSGKPIVIDKPILFVGRDPGCDIILSDSRKVSRKHCCIALVNEQLIVRDLGSMNGVWINGNRINREGDVSVGDELAIGDVRYELEDSRPAEKREKGRGDSGDGLRTLDDPVDEDDSAYEDDGPTPPPKIRPPKALDLSQDVPIPIADESGDFSVESSRRIVPRSDDDRPSGEDDEFIMLRDD